MKQHSLKKAWKLTSYCMKPYRLKYIVAIVFMIIACFASGLNPYVIGLLITELSKNAIAINEGVSGAGVNFEYVIEIIIIFIGFSLVRQVFTYAANYIIGGAVQASFRDLRSQISEKMNRLPVSYFDHHQQGTILSTITNDVDAVSNALQQSLLPIVGAISSIAITYIMLFYISIPLGAISSIMVPAVFFLSRLVMKRSQRDFLEMQNSLADLNGYIQEQYTAFNVVKLYNYEEKSIEGFYGVNERLNKYGFKASFVSMLLTPLMEVLITSTYALMVLLTGFAVLNGMPIGDMQAFCQYIWFIFDPLGQLTQTSTALQSAVASMERIVIFLEEAEEDQEKEKPQVEDFSQFKGHVKFDHVAFSYSPTKPLIKDLNFEAKPGETIAIVGATGAGKSTIINLLMRFYDIKSGSITIDGESIYDMCREQERSLFGMVLQDAWLYNASISENIRFGRLDASNYEIVEAAKMANVHHFIKTLPQGYDTIINEEASNVSLGQKQLLTIARAMLADPRIIILDEATSSVDTRLEMLIQKAMNKVMEGRTSFVVAHRLSTIRDADLILVLDQGDIVEKGTHQELLERKGIYENLYRNQFAEE